jgi:hypothetical protein
MMPAGQSISVRGKMRRIPLSLKIGYAVWLAVWVPIYWTHSGPQNFFWLCDVAVFLVGLALWLESPLLMSSQAAGVLFVQILWCGDFFGRLILGRHPIGGTEYMFDPAKPVYLRMFSLFHVAMPPLLLWAVRRLGYDRRGWLLQTAITCVLLPATWLAVDPVKNVNWVWKPFGQQQELLSPPAYLIALLFLYPLLLYWPTHLALSRWMKAK